ncbi:hypothetical protein WICPIJ_000964 [Wickerhamomyces pijperi]|uniref:Hap4 transcription factor heteromerisation domain-containing protein n=1 Tax=Wickerhamomyces pijperi TaxID=599730 RepID=A0A9P8TR84_WICPI|nr:hypothetical protein WICPIJ_000964 [Wickerhamomyces pijperi]
MESNSQILTQLSQISNTTTTTVQSKPQLIQLAQKPLLVKTSKTWTLPPKPKPGRKSTTPPVALAPASSATAATAHHMEIKPKPRKQYKKKPTKEEAKLESALKKVKDENQLLKQELSKLVSDLKSLQQQQQQQRSSPPFHRSPSSASVVSNDSDLTSTEHHHHHRKRNLSEMLNQEAQFSSFINADSLSRDSLVEFDDDDIASVVSQTPSLMSHSSSVSSSYSSLSMDLSSSLSSIKEESNTVSKPLIKANAISKFSSCLSSPTFTAATSSVKIDEFLTPLYNINEATKPPQQLQQLQPNVMQDDFEFQFLKDEISIIDVQDRQISSAGNEYFNWE